MAHEESIYELEPGTVLGDRFRIRRVALKSARPGHRNRLPPETRAAGEVSRSGEIDSLSMECIEGETLQERIQREGPLPEPQARNVVRQICGGLAPAHFQSADRHLLEELNRQPEVKAMRQEGRR